MRSRAVALAASLLAVALAGGGTAAAASLAPAAPPPVHGRHHHHHWQFRLCGQDQQMIVKGWHASRLLVRNDYWHGQRPQCLLNIGRHADFRVAQSAGRATVVEAFPYIFDGCAWNSCTIGTDLPKKVSALRQPTVSWVTSQHASGMWNAALDIWFGKHPMKTGQADGAEIMVWLNTHHLPGCQGWPHFRLAGRRWCVENWRTNHPGMPRWNYVQFRMIPRHWHIKHLRLAPLFHYAERRRWLKKHWYLENLEAGFEIWRGGKGLRTKWYSPHL